MPFSHVTALLVLVDLQIDNLLQSTGDCRICVPKRKKKKKKKKKEKKGGKKETNLKSKETTISTKISNELWH
jgi:hypothetical protein